MPPTPLSTPASWDNRDRNNGQNSLRIVHQAIVDARDLIGANIFWVAGRVVRVEKCLHDIMKTVRSQIHSVDVVVINILLVGDGTEDFYSRTTRVVTFDGKSASVDGSVAVGMGGLASAAATIVAVADTSTG